MDQPSVNKRKKITHLSESGGLGVGPSISEWVLVVVVSITISSEDDDTENF
jgi:hypothetical protein